MLPDGPPGPGGVPGLPGVPGPARAESGSFASDRPDLGPSAPRGRLGHPRFEHRRRFDARWQPRLRGHRRDGQAQGEQEQAGEAWRGHVKVTPMTWLPRTV